MDRINGRGDCMMQTRCRPTLIYIFIRRARAQACGENRCSAVSGILVGGEVLRYERDGFMTAPTVNRLSRIIKHDATVDSPWAAGCGGDGVTA